MNLVLPVDESLEAIRQKLSRVSNLVVVAAPGAGKTTRVPPALLSLTPKKILMLQPRRIAARASAERIAEENQWTLGQQVGYRVRFEDCTSEKTQLIIVTEALLLRELIKDPELSEYGVIIFDEFHERNLYSDAGLAAVRELQQLSRPDLKIVVMSATLSTQPLLDYLAPAEGIDVPGRIFPVELHYDQQSQSLQTDRAFIDRVAKKVFEALTEQESDKHILVFLPGLSEIQRVEEALLNKPAALKNHRVVRLHGSLSLEEQHRVLHTRDGKIILATNVAETSLTIDGVNTVIDSGLARELQNDQRRLFPWLKTTRISRASAEQRKGRAGRQYPGRCFRLWTKLDDQSMPPFAAPDIVTQDLSELFLLLCQLGVSSPSSFSWFEAPPVLSVDRSRAFLANLGVISIQDGLWRLTDKGQWIQRIPLSPRLSALLHEGLQKNKVCLAAQTASLLNERDPWARDNLESWSSSAQDSDLIPRLTTLNQASPPREFALIEKVAKQLCRLVGSPYSKTEMISSSVLADLLLGVFKDRLARRRRPKEPSGLVIGQKGVELSSRSLVRDAEFFICLTGHANESNGNAIVDLAHPIAKTVLLQRLSADIVLKKAAQFFPEKDQWMSVEQKVLEDLPLEDPSYRPLELTTETLTTIVRESFSQWKLNLPSLEQFYRRQELARTLWPNSLWPELSHWEQETIEMACLGETSLQTVRDKNWSELFGYTLPSQEQRLLRDDLPEKMTTARGRSINLIYEPQGSVRLELKIQEAFGWKETPKIAQGKIKVRLVLLGPHLRPLQTTDDLDSFWRGTYQDLRPSLKARYPKHSWPEDPTQ